LTRRNHAHALRVLAEIAARHDDPDVVLVESHYRHAFDLAMELNMRPLAAHCHLGLGKLYRRTDKDDQAREHLTTYWLEKAEAELTP
jgi:hypothetical protein